MFDVFKFTFIENIMSEVFNKNLWEKPHNFLKLLFVDFKVK